MIEKHFQIVPNYNFYENLKDRYLKYDKLTSDNLSRKIFVQS